jgi:hypothetical protein
VASVISLLKNEDVIYQGRCFAKEGFPFAVSGFGILKFNSFNILCRKLLKAQLFSKISSLFLSHLHIFLFDSFFVFSSLCSSCMSSFVFCILFFLPHVPPFVSLFLPSVFVWCRVSASIMVDVCLLHLDLQQKLSSQASVTGPDRELMKAVGKV